jgi:hypothetical protein
MRFPIKDVKLLRLVLVDEIDELLKFDDFFSDHSGTGL